ncbi:restriction endonuclease subunit S [Cellulophaga baltica]|uniref:restriction endonuclease subunit S n=1 Tax=Cellulophaga baltica TaxID=76594 RepID=UPI0024943BB1|nr:restriction endonuclease subunit S [Cellulophaga baltica]
MPKNWKTYKLEKVATLQRGFDLPSRKRVQGKYPIIAASGFTAWHNEYKVKGPGVTTGRSGTLGKVFYEANDYWPLNTSLWVKNFNGNYPRYIYYFLKTLNFNEFNSGTSVPTLNRNDVHSLDVNVPPLPEQKAIASILSTIDDKIENNLAMNKTLEDMAMALYKHWFIDFGQELENTLADYVNLNPRLSIKKGELASYVNMKALPTEGMSVSEVDKVVVKGGAKFQNGDTLLARITPCLENGKTAFVDFLDENEIGFGSTEFLVLRAKEGISKYWVYCLSRDTNLVNHAVSCMIGTSGRQRVQNNPFLQYELPEINKETMVSFEKKVEPWFKKVKANTNENQTLTKLRDSLLPKLISGEVRLKEFEEEITDAL